MLQRFIPIRSLPLPLALPGPLAQEPRLSGEADCLRRLLAGLDELACAAFGRALPRGAWLRELHLTRGEAVLSLAPALQCRGADFAQAAFELMKQELSNTDIYVRAAAH